MSILIADMGSQNTVDMTKLAGSGCFGVIHRATRSNQETDPLYQSRRAAAKALKLHWSGYAFNTGETASIQVTRFVNFAAFSADEGAWLDLERNPGGAQMTLASTIAFLDGVDQKLGRYCGLYSGDVIKSLAARATDEQRDFLAAHPFWLCEYGPVAKMVDVNGHPLPWVKPQFWQFSSDGVGPEPHTLPGLENGADLSSFDGTADELADIWAGAPISPVTA